jgi:hypothetical protein
MARPPGEFVVRSADRKRDYEPRGVEPAFDSPQGTLLGKVSGWPDGRIEAVADHPGGNLGKASYWGPEERGEGASSTLTPSPAGSTRTSSAGTSRGPRPCAYGPRRGRGPTTGACWA